jgi:hypothetical protein
MIVLEVMSYQELALALSTKKQAQTKIMNDTPGQSMRKVENKRACWREGRKESESKTVKDDEDQHDIRGSNCH